ncbi:MAG: PAS domain S-box protein, partial [Alphaproteobacteria bacterium]|nr:PAS domain S-box protein [Alphaproteobacteria bacterium]
MTSDAATETVSVSEPIARRLALRLIVGIVAFSTLVAVLVSGAQIWIEYDRDITSLRGRFELVRESYLESVTENAWLADTARLRTLLAGIGRLPDIVQANVRLTNGPTVDVGTPPLNQAVERLDLPLRRLYRGREVEIGTFTVIASLEGPRQRLLDRALFIIVGNGIKTCLVILFALFLIRRLVTHRLETITRHVRDIAVSGYGGGRLAESDFAAGAEDDEIALLGRQYNAALAALETDRRKLAEKERQIRGLIVATPFALAVTDAESGEILFANEAQARLIGATPETARGRSFSDSYLRPEDRKEWLALLERDGQIRDFEFPIRRADGAVAWISLSATRIQFEGRDAILGAFYDVTDRRKAQYQLRLAETAFANALEAIMVTDADGTIVSVNRAFTDITGYTAEEAIGRTPRLLRSDRQDADFYRAFWRELKTRGTHSGEIWNRRKNGEAYIQHQAITAIRDERGNIV